jgi:CBS domain-containing protein
MNQVQDLMTREVITVTSDTPLIEAVDIVTKHNFNGLPVVDSQNKLVGLLTEHTLLLSDSFIHLKTLLKLFHEFEFYKKDNSSIKEDLKKLMSLQVKDGMVNQPITLFPDSSVEQAAQVLGNPGNNPVPVIDKDRKLVGILSLSDLTKLYGISVRDPYNHKDLDKNIDQFLNKFEKQFIVVSRFRTETWLLTSIFFAVVGFIIAFIFILRINL